MTITARRVLTAIVAVSVLGTGMALAQNSVPYSNDFESATLYAPATNMANWSSTTDDQSMVTNMTYLYGGTLPSWPSGTAKILKLNTQGSILTNSLVSTSATNGIYMDTMVQFVPSDTTPATCTTGDTYSVKLALFANASSNLVVYHGYANGSGGLSSNGLTVLPNVMDAAQWYRLTVLYKRHAVPSYNEAAMFQLKVDGVLITNSAAYAGGWEGYMDANTGLLPALDPNGTWFMASAGANIENVTAVAFQGTGYIDDLLVSTSDPFAQAQGATTFLLSVVKGANGNASPLGLGIEVPIATGTTVVYNASNWYRIDTLTSNGVTVVGGSDSKVFTQTVTSAGAAVSNNVTFKAALYSQVGGFVTNEALRTFGATWYPNNEAGAAADSNLTYDWMLNQDPTATYTAALAVKSIAVTDSTNVSVVVTLSGVPVTNVTIKGTLRLNGSTDLTTWTPIGAATVDEAVFNAAGDSTPAINFVSVAPYTFFKAEIIP
jgi:hypothetical protein